MKGYASVEMFSRAELRLWERATELVERIPEKWEPRCHELARAMFQLVKGDSEVEMELKDGKFGAVEHSWISLPPRHVLDVYTPGRVPLVTLHDLHWGLPDRQMYVSGATRSDIDNEMVQKLVSRMRGVPCPACNGKGIELGTMTHNCLECDGTGEENG